MLRSIARGLLPLAVALPLVLLQSGSGAVPDAASASSDDVLATAVVGKKGKKNKNRKKAKQPEQVPAEVAAAVPAEPEVVFADDAFPPTIPDTEWHQEAWLQDDCLRCHETGVEEAPVIVHAGMVPILLKAKCRSCHVLIPGSQPRPARPEETIFAKNAFPPMIPASGSHREAWTRDDCLLCHDGGIAGAPEVRHESLPPILLTAKCRSCHVQVRADEASGPQ